MKPSVPKLAIIATMLMLAGSAGALADNAAGSAGGGNSGGGNASGGGGHGGSGGGGGGHGGGWSGGGGGWNGGAMGTGGAAHAGFAHSGGGGGWNGGGSGGWSHGGGIGAGGAARAGFASAGGGGGGSWDAGGAARAGFAHADGTPAPGFPHNGFGHREGFGEARAAHEHHEDMREGLRERGEREERGEHRFMGVAQNSTGFSDGCEIYGGGYTCFPYSPYFECEYYDPQNIGKNFLCDYPRKKRVR